MADPDDGFLSRWSRRKQAEREDEPAPAPEPEAQPDDDEVLAEEEANRLAAEALDLDAMTYGDDFSTFLRRGVPDALRKKAMQKFFRSNPILANVDGLNEYDEDYNNPAHKVYKSSWDLVRGFLTEDEMAAQQSTGRLTAPVDDPEQEPELAEEPDPAEEEVTEVAIETPEEPDPADDPPADVAPEAEPEPEDTAPPRVSLRSRWDV